MDYKKEYHRCFELITELTKDIRGGDTNINMFINSAIKHASALASSLCTVYDLLKVKENKERFPKE